MNASNDKLSHSKGQCCNVTVLLTKNDLFAKELTWDFHSMLLQDLIEMSKVDLNEIFNVFFTGVLWVFT